MSNIDKLVSANNRFAFKLFAEVARQDTGQNIFISPSSIATALAMTYNGAGGKTQEAMAETLELHGMSLDKVNRANAKLREALKDLDPQVRLAMANSLWAKQGITFKPDFIERNQKHYAAQVTNLPQSPAVINQWVSTKTALPYWMANRKCIP